MLFRGVDELLVLGVVYVFMKYFFFVSVNVVYRNYIEIDLERGFRCSFDGYSGLFLYGVVEIEFDIFFFF